MIDVIRTRYRAIRRQVYAQATEPADANEQRHTENKIRFRDAVIALCEQANLSHCDAPTQAARIALWHHLWTKNRYAGIRAQIATTEIDQLTALFDSHVPPAEPEA